MVFNALLRTERLTIRNYFTSTTPVMYAAAFPFDWKAMENLKTPFRWMKSGSIATGLAIVCGAVAGPVAAACVLDAFFRVTHAAACVAVGGAA